MQKVSTLLLLLTTLFSCKPRTEVYSNVEIVVGRLQGIQVLINDSVVGYTDHLGTYTVSELTSLDSLRLFDPDFTFTREKFWTSSPQFSYRFLPHKRQSAKDSAAISFLLSLQKANGLLPSIEGGDLVSTYDQALAVIAFCKTGHLQEAENILDYFESQRVSELESGLGGFHQFRSTSGVPTGNRWMGDNAWLLIAVSTYHATVSQGIRKYYELEGSLHRWLASLEDPYGDGLYGGYLPNGDTIHKITEGNIDAFVAFGNNNDLNSSILRHLEADKWDPVDGNLMAWPTNPSYKYALDCNTWAYCAFPEYPESARDNLDKFEISTTSTITGELINGYCFDEDQDVLWFEGTGQVAVMHWVAGDHQAAKEVLEELEKGWITTANGEQGLPYAANHGTGYGATDLWTAASTDPCISSTAWYLMASYRYNPLGFRRFFPTEAKPIFWD